MPINNIILKGFAIQLLKPKFFAFEEFQESAKNPVATSYLGTPVFTNIEFLEGTYVNLEGESIDYLRGNEPGLRIDTCLITVSQQKIIKTTQIQGRNGTVKEYISDGDFDVSIRGLISSNNPNEYPEEEVLKLMELLKVQKEVGISSQFLNDIFGITDLVITSYSLPELEGYSNIQPFEIKALSEVATEIIIRNESK